MWDFRERVVGTRGLAGIFPLGGPGNVPIRVLALGADLWFPFRFARLGLAGEPFVTTPEAAVAP